MNIANGVVTTVCEANEKIVLTAYDLTDWRMIEEAETALVPKASKSTEPSAALFGGNILVKKDNGGLMLQNVSNETIEICKANVKSFALWENMVLYTTRDALMLYDLESAQTAELYTLPEDELFFGGLMSDDETAGVFIERRTVESQSIIWLELKK